MINSIKEEKIKRCKHWPLYMISWNAFNSDECTVTKIDMTKNDFNIEDINLDKLDATPLLSTGKGYVYTFGSHKKDRIVKNIERHLHNLYKKSQPSYYNHFIEKKVDSIDGCEYFCNHSCAMLNTSLNSTISVKTLKLIVDTKRNTIKYITVLMNGGTFKIRPCKFNDFFKIDYETLHHKYYIDSCGHYISDNGEYFF